MRNISHGVEDKREETIMNQSTTATTRHLIGCASLAAIGLKLRELDLFDPIGDQVFTKEKLAHWGMWCLCGSERCGADLVRRCSRRNAHRRTPTERGVSVTQRWRRSGGVGHRGRQNGI